MKVFCKLSMVTDFSILRGPLTGPSEGIWCTVCLFESFYIWNTLKGFSTYEDYFERPSAYRRNLQKTLKIWMTHWPMQNSYIHLYKYIYFILNLLINVWRLKKLNRELFLYLEILYLSRTHHYQQWIDIFVQFRSVI